MANKTVYSGKQWRVGILLESAFGTKQAAGSNFNRLPLESINMPTLTVNERYGIRSGNASLLELDIDCFRTQKGGSVEWGFEMVVEREFLARFLASVFQDHNGSGSSPYIHSFESKSGAQLVRPAWGSPSDGIPLTFTIALDNTGNAGEGVVWGGNVLRELTITADPSSNEGRFSVSGTFYSGFSSDTANGFQTEQTCDGTWVEPGTNYMFPTYTKRQMAVDGASITDMFIRSWDVTISNGVERLGYDSNGDAETYKFAVPGFEITGNLSCKYDATADLGSGVNPMQHFLEKSSGAQVKFEDTVETGSSDAAAVDAAGEWTCEMNIYYTGQPELDLGGDEVFWNIPYRVVMPTSSGAASGTAFNFTIADSTVNTAW